MREATQVRLSENSFSPEVPPKTKFQDRLVGRVVIGVGCSSAVFLIVHHGGIKEALRYVFSIGNRTMGDPDLIEKADKKADDVLKELKDIAKQHKENATTLPIAVPALSGLNPVKAAGNAVNQKIEDVKDDIKDAIGTMAPAVHAAQGAMQQRKAERDAEELEQLRVKATEYGIEWDENTSLDELRAKVHARQQKDADAKKEAFIEWWDVNGPNGYCSKRHPIRVSREGDAYHTCKHSGCGARARASAFRANGPVPLPRQYPPSFLKWWNNR